MSCLTTREVAEAIARAVDRKEPFSLVRLGDGEAKLLGYPKHVARRDLNAQLSYWFGDKGPDIGQVMTLQGELAAACRNADVLGLPTPRRQSLEKFSKLMAFLAATERLVSADTAHCGVHRLMHEDGLYGEFLAGLPRVTVIGCRDVRESLSSAFGIPNVRWIPVPVEGQMGQPKERHYPERFSVVLRQIDAGPGDVFLIGAGPCGKVYCDAVKRDGGVGLDVGSMLDAWAGVASRSYIRREPERYRL